MKPQPTWGRRALTLVLRTAIPVVMLAWLVNRYGADAFRPALQVLRPVPILAALILGGAAIAAQAARWRVTMRGVGLALPPKAALAECYRAAALNVVLPGGVVGDALRAWRRHTGQPSGWRAGAGSVIAERSAGLAVLLGATAATLVVVQHLGYAALAAAGAGVAWVAAWPTLRRLDRTDRLRVWGWSWVALFALVALTLVVGAALSESDPIGWRTRLAIGLLVLAGMAVPLNLGGWGPREAAGALGAALVGGRPEYGVAVAAGYGLLSTVSVLPGFVVLALTMSGRAREVELDADLSVEEERSGGGAQGVGKFVVSDESNSRNPVTDQQGRGGDPESIERP